MLKYEILRFLISHSNLTYNGIEWNQNNSNHKQHIVDLFQYLIEIEKCMDQLDEFFVPSSRKKDKTNSYSLNHYVEK